MTPCQAAVRVLCAMLSATIIAWTSTSAGYAASSTGAHDTGQFPLSVASTGRYLQDARGRPFLIHGDTAWSLIAALKREEVELYLADRRARGFNTLLVSLIESRFSKNPPANAYGDRPFGPGREFAAPIEAYFKHADWVLQRASDLGFLVLLTPAYMGYGGGDQGWYREMVKAGPEALQAYGRYLGKRYAGFTNIVWVHAGDYNPPDRRLAIAIAEGIVETSPSTLHTAHGAPETAALDYWPSAFWLTLNNVYTYGRVLPAAAKQHRRSDRKPFILIESAYENEHGATPTRLRAQAYDALLSGAAGQIFGNNPIWHFDGPGLHPAPVDWKQALASPGAESMRHVRALMERLPWWTLEPAEQLIVDKRVSMSNQAVAARMSDGSGAVVYLPGGLPSVTIDLAGLGIATASAQWFDPATGEFMVADIPASAGGRQIFRLPGLNGGGAKDWVLLLWTRP